jgi:hypothetical protein
VGVAVVAKPFDKFYPLTQRIVGRDNSATLNSVKGFCGMKATCRYIAISQQRSMIMASAECMSTIINNLEFMFISDGVYPIDVTGKAKYVNWHYSLGSTGYSRLDFFGVNAIIVFSYIYEDWSATLPENR